jgi:hypothetical protein
MSFTGKRFGHDIFLSYAHGDPRGGGKSPLKHWSHRLADELIQDIQAVATELTSLDVFIDRDIDPTAKLTPTLQHMVRESALLLIIMSPRYLASDWCQNEASWFEEEVRRREQTEGWVLVVRALPTEDEKWPPFLKDERGHTITGFWFHKRPPGPSTRAFGWPDPRPEDREFYEVLARLSGLVIKRLKELSRQEELRREEEARGRVIATVTPIVYLHARTMDAARWRKVREFLVADGIEVVPEELCPVEADLATMQAVRRTRLQQCAKANALLILRPKEGDWIDTEIESVGHIDRIAVEAFEGRQLPCAVLDVIGGGVKSAAKFGVDIVDGQCQGWLAALRKWIESRGDA